jgi:hypothetical protein
MLGLRYGGIVWFMSSKVEDRIVQARVDNLLSMCEAIKSVKYNDEQSLRDFYFYCLSERKRGNYYSLDCFRKWFPKFFNRMQSILNKRSSIKSDLEFMQSLKMGRVYFGALTYNEELDSKSEENKRKMAQRYLDKFMPIYEIIEEYGEEKGRYHVHFLGVMSSDKTYIEFHSGWSSYSYIEPLKSVKKASKYLCDYVVKQVPRIRRNKRLITLMKSSKDSKEFIEAVIDSSSELPF